MKEAIVIDDSMVFTLVEDDLVVSAAMVHGEKSVCSNGLPAVLATDLYVNAGNSGVPNNNDEPGYVVYSGLPDSNDENDNTTDDLDNQPVVITVPTNNDTGLNDSAAVCAENKDRHVNDDNNVLVGIAKEEVHDIFDKNGCSNGGVKDTTSTGSIDPVFARLMRIRDGSLAVKKAETAKWLVQRAKDGCRGQFDQPFLRPCASGTSVFFSDADASKHRMKKYIFRRQFVGECNQQ